MLTCDFNMGNMDKLAKAGNLGNESKTFFIITCEYGRFRSYGQIIAKTYIVVEVKIFRPPTGTECRK